MADVEVRNDSEQSRYEAWVGGELAGFAEYVLRGDAIVFTHTEVFGTFEGQGVGSSLARGALDAVRADGEYDVIPLCPFVKGWIEKHPDYHDLVRHD